MQVCKEFTAQEMDANLPPTHGISCLIKVVVHQHALSGTRTEGPRVSRHPSWRESSHSQCSARPTRPWSWLESRIYNSKELSVRVGIEGSRHKNIALCVCLHPYVCLRPHVFLNLPTRPLLSSLRGAGIGNARRTLFVGCALYAPVPATSRASYPVP